MSQRDYVVQTHPCSEAIAQSNLSSRGFEVYLPTVVEEIRTGRLHNKRNQVLVPLFPRYIFVRFDIHISNWRTISTTRGVQRLLGWDSEHPTPLLEGALDELRGRFEAGEFVKRDRTYQITAGDHIRVTSGAFAGHSGVCTVSRGDRIRVLLSRISGAVNVDLPAKLVAVIA